MTNNQQRVTHAWGRRGAREAARRGDVIVVVDVLRFSTAVTTAVQHGAIIYPCSLDEDAQALAESVGAELAHARRGDPVSRFSLSSLSYMDVAPGTKVVLPSPNGATCVIHAREVPSLLVGALVNARAVAAALVQIVAEAPSGVTVVSAGERWPEPASDEGMRVAIEDLLGAGAILSALQVAAPAEQLQLAAEALVCRNAFDGSRQDLHDLLWDSESGRELRRKDFPGDVKHAAQLDLYDAVPVMRGGALIAYPG